MKLPEIVKSKGKAYPFPKLADHEKKSIIQFYFVEGDSDFSHISEFKALELSEVIDSDEPLWDKLIPLFDKLYEDEIYFVYNIPTSDFKRFIQSETDILDDEFASFDEYHKEYNEANDASHSRLNRWPSIAECEDEGIIDGWHRIHDYIRNGDENLPLIVSSDIK